MSATTLEPSDIDLEKSEEMSEEVEEIEAEVVNVSPDDILALVSR